MDAQPGSELVPVDKTDRVPDQGVEPAEVAAAGPAVYVAPAWKLTWWRFRKHKLAVACLWVFAVVALNAPPHAPPDSPVMLIALAAVSVMVLGVSVVLPGAFEKKALAGVQAELRSGSDESLPTSLAKHSSARVFASPRTALAVLSGLSVSDLATAVSLQDAAVLTRVPGIGKKTAERLLLELKGKIAESTKPQEAGPTDVVNALVGLGYSEKEALAAVKGLPAGIGVAEGGLTYGLVLAVTAFTY